VREAREEAQAEGAADLSALRRQLLELQRAHSSANREAPGAAEGEASRELRRQLADANRSAERARREAGDARRQLDEGAADLRAAHADAERSRLEAADARENLSLPSPARTAGGEDVLDALRVQLGEARLEAQEYRAGAEAAAADARAARAETERAQAECVRVEREAVILRGGREQADREQADSERDQATRETSLSQSNSQLTQSNSELSKNSELLSLREAHEATRAERDELVRNLERARRADSAAKDAAGDLAQARTRIGELEAEVQEAQDEAAEASTEVSRLDRELQAATRELHNGAELSDSLREAEARTADAEDALAEAQAQADAERDAREREEADTLALRRALEQMRNQLAAEERKAADARAALEEARAEVRRTRGELKKSQEQLFRVSHSLRRSGETGNNTANPSLSGGSVSASAAPSASASNAPSHAHSRSHSRVSSIASSRRDSTREREGEGGGEIIRPDPAAAPPGTLLPAVSLAAAAAAAQRLELRGGDLARTAEPSSSSQQLREGQGKEQSPPVEDGEARGGSVHHKGGAEAEARSKHAEAGRALRRFVVAYTHPGGIKAENAKNQDAFFVLEMDDRNAAYGVFDGHGGQNGALAAQVATDSVKAHLQANWAQLRTDPTRLFTNAFEQAHKAIRVAIKATSADISEDSLCVLVEDGEAVDGGTTATVCVVIDGSTLIHAQVGDSSAALGGWSADPEEGGEEGVLVEELMADHTPDEVGEYKRVAELTGLPHKIRFIYDTSDAFDGPEFALDMFRLNASSGEYELDLPNRKRADAKGVGFKNARGDRPTVVVTPHDGPYAEQALGMTRSLGDFYLHACGVTWQPEVSVVDLEQVMAALRAPVLFLASDGFWDLWSYQEVFEHVVCEGPDSRRYATAMEFKRVNGQKGNAEFGDSCDNMTGIFIYLEREADHVVEEEAGRGGKGDGDDGDGDGGGEDWI